MKMESPPEGRRGYIAQLLAWCDESLQTHPSDVEKLLKISAALWDMGRRAEALEYARKILTLHPGHAEAREAIQRYTAEWGGAACVVRLDREERS